MSLDITITQMKRVQLFELSGRVDTTNAGDLGIALDEALNNGHNHLVVDMSQVAYLSSAGLRELVKGRNRAKQGVTTGDLCIACPSEKVLNVLELAGLDSVFQIFETQAEAVGSF